MVTRSTDASCAHIPLGISRVDSKGRGRANGAIGKKRAGASTLRGEGNPDYPARLYAVRRASNRLNLVFVVAVERELV